MAQVCGTHPGLRVARWRPRGLRVLRALALCAAAAALVSTTEAARADSAPPRHPPQPQNLWHAYPLDDRSPGASPTPASPAAAEPTSTNSNGAPVLLWVAVAAFGAAAVAFAVWWRRSGRSWPLADRLVADHGLVFATQGPHVHARVSPRLQVSVARLTRMFTETVRRPAPVDAKVEQSPAANASAAPDDSAAERSLLKRKGADPKRSETRKLKEKERRMPRERGDDDVSVLKAKLAESSSHSPAQRPVSVAAPASLRPFRANRCRIGWWRGYVKSEFYAHLPSPDGRFAVVARSPAFRWSKAEPPPADAAGAVQAHAVLREELEAAGWIAARQGKDWYAVEFERPPVGGGRGRAEHEH
jgi:hypothetical protein